MLSYCPSDLLGPSDAKAVGQCCSDPNIPVLSVSASGSNPSEYLISKSNASTVRTTQQSVPARSHRYCQHPSISPHVLDNLNRVILGPLRPPADAYAKGSNSGPLRPEYDVKRRYSRYADPRRIHGITNQNQATNQKAGSSNLSGRAISRWTHEDSCSFRPSRQE
jgi:hypothetical protein